MKTADYIPSPELPDEEYPLRLSTGRKVHHFYTRTNTGWPKALQEKCPEPWIELSAEDTNTVSVRDGDEVLVRSRKGAVQMKASICNVSMGETFIPFHFGYWDAADGRSRAANELTKGGSLGKAERGRNLLIATQSWDPVSKQASFKFEASRIERCTETEIVQEKEVQSDTISNLMKLKLTEVSDNYPDNGI